MELTPQELSDVQTSITSRRFLPLWIIQCGFMMGPIFFAIVVYAVYRDQAVNPPHPETGILDLMSILTWVTVGLTGVSSFFVFLTYRFPGCMRWVSARKNIMKTAQPTRNTDTAPEALLFQNLIVRIILRLAILEAPAMFGLAVFLVGVQTGGLYNQPDFWLNALPTAVFFFYTLATLPTKDSVLTQQQQIHETWT